MGKQTNRLYYERKEKGLCPRCGRIPDGNYVYCGRCMDMMYKARKAYIQRRKLQKKAQLEAPPIVYIDDDPPTTPAPTPEPPAKPVSQEPGPTPAGEEILIGEAAWKTPGVHKTNLRKCHDCGKPTTDYRCQACRDKWRRKHGVTSWAFGDEPDAVNL